MNLLIVNDEIVTAETMKSNIDWQKYGIQEVFTAYDVSEGKACVGNNNVNIMLCDIEMPGENGMMLLKWVKEQGMDVECIFLTCHASFEYAKEAINLGCQDYLLIPAQYEDIGAAVKKVVMRIEENRQARKYQEYGKQMIMDKLEQAVQCHGQKKNAKELIQDAVKYILENLGSESLCVNDVAERLYLHPAYLNRIFKKGTGESVGQFIIGERMKLASELLKSQKLNANAIAEQVGYKSYSNFTLMFRKYYGCSPGKFSGQE